MTTEKENKRSLVWTPCPALLEREWWYDQRLKCLGCGLPPWEKKEGRTCNKLPPYFVPVRYCLCCGGDLTKWDISTPWSVKKQGDCLGCWKWRTVSIRRKQQEGKPLEDIGWLYSMLHKPVGKDLVKYAAKVEEDCEGLGYVDKLVKKRRIEKAFQRSVEQTMQDKMEQTMKDRQEE